MISRFIESPCEDSLTAAVISQLLHLPFETAWMILRRACFSNDLPASPGEPLLVDPWPVWSASGTANSNYVEPDYFFRFADFDLIVEAKRWDRGMQSRDQWRRELIAYANEFGEDDKEVRILALGGIHGEKDETCDAIPSDAKGKVARARGRSLSCRIHMCLWSRILQQCQKMERELKGMDFATSQSIAHRRILGDLIDLFSCHGFQTGIWYEETLRHRPRLGAEVKAAHSVLSSISSTLAP